MHFCLPAIVVHFSRFTSRTQSYPSFGSTHLRRSCTPSSRHYLTYHRIPLLWVTDVCTIYALAQTQSGGITARKVAVLANCQPICRSVDRPLLSGMRQFRWGHCVAVYGVCTVPVHGSRTTPAMGLIVVDGTRSCSLCHVVTGNERGVGEAGWGWGWALPSTWWRALLPGGVHPQKREGRGDGRPLDVGLSLSSVGWRQNRQEGVSKSSLSGLAAHHELFVRLCCHRRFHTADGPRGHVRRCRPRRRSFRRHPLLHSPVRRRDLAGD